MQNNTTKVILAVMLGIAGIFSIIHGITASSPRRSRSASPAAAVVRSQRQAPEGKALPAERFAARTRFKGWRRHLFAPSGTYGDSSALVLNGIFAKGKTYKAMIGDTIVMKGDKIGPNTVVDVQKNKVILNDGTKDFELNL